jgi:hypothetical protein
MISGSAMPSPSGRSSTEGAARGSRLTMIAAITEPAVTAAILGHLGLDDTPPPARRSVRAPPDDRAPELPLAS